MEIINKDVRKGLIVVLIAVLAYLPSLMFSFEFAFRYLSIMTMGLVILSILEVEDLKKRLA